MKNSLGPIACLYLGACTAPPHIFVVTADEPVAEAILEFNGTSSKMAERNGRFGADSWARTGAGTITVKMKNGKTITCPIPPVEDGELEPHKFAIKTGVCAQS